MQATDTIVALSTPPGRSGIGVIRISGPSALKLTRTLLKESEFDPQPNQARLKAVRDPASGEIVDRAIVTYFKAPRSFTGEDVIELSCHGSPTLLTQVVDALLFLGAKAADPGEFTMRALSNGRLNLSQAEAIRDLIDARTHEAVRHAARQLGGEFSSLLQPIKDELIAVIVPLESSLEFVEDDLPDDITDNIGRKLAKLASTLEEMAATFRTGRLFREGLKVTLAGRPNVGKSSVFNKLLALDRAIVTDVPGTTRDSLSEVVNLKGVPVLLTDTAGLRSSSDLVEKLGIERTKRSIIEADLVVVVLDGSQPLKDEDLEVLAVSAANRHVVALNKNDAESFDPKVVRHLKGVEKVVSISARTGEGLDKLSTAILEPFVERETFHSDFVITNARHYDLLRRASDSLRSSEGLLKERASEEILLVGLYDALRYLGEITGETTPEDVLTQIFSSFCIGK